MDARRLVFAGLLLALVGCGDDPQPPPAAPATQPGDPPTDDRVRKLGAADAVGYDGAAIQRSVQRTVDSAAEQQRRTDEAARGANGQ